MTQGDQVTAAAKKIVPNRALNRPVPNGLKAKTRRKQRFNRYTALIHYRITPPVSGPSLIRPPAPRQTELGHGLNPSILDKFEPTCCYVSHFCSSVSKYVLKWKVLAQPLHQLLPHTV